MIKEAKDLLEKVVSRRVPGVTVVCVMAEEQRAIIARQWTLVSLITNPGRFDDRESKTVRYPDAEAGVWKEHYVRGRKILPMLLRCWAEGAAADLLFSRLLPAISRKWEYDGFEGLIVIDITARPASPAFVINASRLSFLRRNTAARIRFPSESFMTPPPLAHLAYQGIKASPCPRRIPYIVIL